MAPGRPCSTCATRRAERRSYRVSPAMAERADRSGFRNGFANATLAGHSDSEFFRQVLSDRPYAGKRSRDGRAVPIRRNGVFEGRHYLFAYAKTDGHRNFAGLGWSVLVRQDAQIALAPVRQLQNQMIVWGLGFSILATIAAWTVAGRIAAPLLRLSRAAQNIRAAPTCKSRSCTLRRGRGSSAPLPCCCDLKQRERSLALRTIRLSPGLGGPANWPSSTSACRAISRRKGDEASPALSPPPAPICPPLLPTLFGPRYRGGAGREAPRLSSNSKTRSDR